MYKAVRVRDLAERGAKRTQPLPGGSEVGRGIGRDLDLGLQHLALHARRDVRAAIREELGDPGAGGIALRGVVEEALLLDPEAVIPMMSAHGGVSSWAVWCVERCGGRLVAPGAVTRGAGRDRFPAPPAGSVARGRGTLGAVDGDRGREGSSGGSSSGRLDAGGGADRLGAGRRGQAEGAARVAR